MRERWSIACHVAAWFMTMSSGLILCACPGWPAIGIAFAASAVWMTPKPRQFTTYLSLIAATVMTGFHILDMLVVTPGRKKAALERENAHRAATNNPPPAATTK